MFRSHRFTFVVKEATARMCGVKFLSGCSKQDGSFVRNAQAAELFRSSFFMSKAQESAIPMEDLDQLVAKDRIRPSVLVNAFEVAGFGLGLMSRFVPVAISNKISEAVDDATVQQFNDSIRDMQLSNIDNVDVKETLKYHRELRGGDAWDCSHADETTNINNGAANVMDAKVALTTMLYHTLKLTTKY